MNAESADSNQPVVLAVDDESVSRAMLRYFLHKANHRTVVVESAAAARHYVATHGPAGVQCVVTDYRMPGETGLELLLWLKQQDAALSVIMITATTERELVAATLRGGANDFLDKPITETKLLSAVANGIELTDRNRRTAEAERAVQQVARTQHQLFGLGAAAEKHLELCYHPRHQAGGDFVNFFQLDLENIVVLSADVSGHDLHAAFVSAYFQGMMRGMLDAGQSITTVLAKFNRFLVEEWGARSGESPSPTQTSVSVCAALVNLARGDATLYNQGFPMPWLVTPDGRLQRCEAVHAHPLGWFSELELEPAGFSSREGGRLCLWTDGLEDLAEALKLSPLALATGLRRVQLRGLALPELAQAKDDVLVVFINLKEAAAGSDWLPVLDESYRGDQRDQIDDLQSYWERSVAMALPELPESRRFDVLLSLREGAINAMLHGCAGRTDRHCRVTLCATPGQRTLRAIISDPGTGHEFTVMAGESEGDIADLHRGLALISRLATHVASARRGAELILDFRY
jgi:FixJ family two-component response regulator/anti-sigma regulatory factor (Ser/Thr protein kinase)